MAIGLAGGLVEVRPYTNDWPRLFEEERRRLYDAIGDYVLDIQHIGSTSVPGLDAKPIIDIGIAVANFEEAAICIGPLERLGYIYHGENGIPRRHFFTQGEPRTHNLHMNELDSHDWMVTMRFRDYLRGHPEAARAYAELKRELAIRHQHDREAYQDGKNQLIQELLRLAMAEADRKS
jgi:GrpB-like predicted nucleotidyltransferase (UPF0157 family)